MLNPSFATIDERELITEFYNKIESNFPVEVVDEIDIPIEHLQSMSHYRHVALEQVIRILGRTEPAYIGPFQLQYTYSAGKAGTQTATDWQAWAFCWLPKDFGHLVIKEEGIKEKLMELLQPLEMNFPEDKEFCRKYYVLSKDPVKAEKLFNTKFRDTVKQIGLKGFQIEVYQDFLIIGNYKNLGNDDVITMARFVREVANIRY